MSDVIYKLDDVSKVYQMNKVEVSALNNVTLDIYKKDIMAFVGPSGSGKSTLLHLLGTIDSPTKGSLYFKEQNIDSLSDRELAGIRSKEIGFIFQNFNLIPVLSVFENIEFPLKLRNKFVNKEVKNKIHSLIEEVGLADYIKHKPGELSGGQRQRVAIARALIIEPSVILADEPTANLDSKTGLKILELMRALSLKHQTTLIFSTHDDKVIDFVDKTVNVEDGEVKI